jgi:hypothetical protein
LLESVGQIVRDPGRMRALGFCVSVAHAQYMARTFTDAGLPSLAVSADTPPEERRTAQLALRRGELRCLFSVDLFNEGVDLPEVDTLLLLRPTASVTVFVQQLGRGLRWSPDKAVLTVLDFIGQHRREYRLDLQLRALTGSPRGRLERDIADGFPYLPSGSQVILDRVSRQVVLANVRAAQRAGGARRELISEARAVGAAELAPFLAATQYGLVDVYRNGASWTDVARRAALDVAGSGPDEGPLLKRVHVLAHVDDPERVKVYTLLADPDGPPTADLSGRAEVLAHMLFHALWPGGGGHASWHDGIAHLRRHPAVCAEIRSLLGVSLFESRPLPRPLGTELAAVPLRSHARYRKDELLAALGWTAGGRLPVHHREGVAWCPEIGVDALLVTLHKDDSFSPTTRYRDYAISKDLFHWESQNRTTLRSPTGRRYVDGGSRVVLFVRDTTDDEIGTAAYTCLGSAEHVEHTGERPIAITWKLRRPMPAELLRAGQVTSA